MYVDDIYLYICANCLVIKLFVVGIIMMNGGKEKYT